MSDGRRHIPGTNPPPRRDASPAVKRMRAAPALAFAHHGARSGRSRVHARTSAQETTRRLLEEQNAEYEASLRADREREAAREAERRRQEEEARVAAELAAREQ